MKILIANRGEIAVRIIRTCHNLGHETVAIHSDSDSNSLHATMAGERFSLPGNEPKDTYLNIPRIIKIAKKAKVDAVHPGYGFLSESAEFVKALNKEKIKFIGPSAHSMQALGDKIAAKKIAKRVQVPLLPSLEIKVKNGMISQKSIDNALQFCKSIGYPTLIKASAGGGGRGMRKVYKPAELVDSLVRASNEALSFFKNGTIFIEKFLPTARHIEVQIFGDLHGEVTSLFDRDCTAQRRHQKIIEEAPAPNISAKTRYKMHAAALRLAKASKYNNAGTVEFLLDTKENFYLLEVNSRLQVEHPVTESITDLDLVAIQIRIAQGEKLSTILKDRDLSQPRGCAIELRVLAESPEDGFIASTGRILHMAAPAKEWLRFDSGFIANDQISHYYDSLLGKLIVHGADRSQAIARAHEALEATIITGVRTNLGFLDRVLSQRAFIEVEHHINWVESLLPTQKDKDRSRFYTAAVFVIAKLLHSNKQHGSWNDGSGWRIFGRAKQFCTIVVDSTALEFSAERLEHESVSVSRSADESIIFKHISLTGNTLRFYIDQKLATAQVFLSEEGCWIKTQYGISKVIEQTPSLRRHSESTTHHAALSSPLPGRVIAVKSSEGAKVLAGDTLLILESMKMEHLVKAPREGSIQRIWVKAGDVVEANKLLVDLDFGS